MTNPSTQLWAYYLGKHTTYKGGNPGDYRFVMAAEYSESCFTETGNPSSVTVPGDMGAPMT